MELILVQKLDKPYPGYWEGGPKQAFEWRIERHFGGTDSKGKFVRVGSWCANHWFYVAVGKTDKATLGNARRHLRAITKVPCEFWYLEVGR
jgi:hypothetical protein